MRGGEWALLPRASHSATHTPGREGAGARVLQMMSFCSSLLNRSLSNCASLRLSLETPTETPQPAHAGAPVPSHTLRITGGGGTNRLSRREEQTTLTDEHAMAAPAAQGGTWTRRAG